MYVDYVDYVNITFILFSEYPGDPQFAFEGKIVKRADCRPVENPGYLSLKK